MPLSDFIFPFPQTRLFLAGNLIYKFKIRAGSNYSGEEVMGGNSFNKELEEIVRTVLGTLNRLQPFSSTRFNVFPYKKRWDGVAKEMCRQCDMQLRAYPYILLLYLEKNLDNRTPAEVLLSTSKEAAQLSAVSEPESKRCRRSSPLEGDRGQGIIHELETKVSTLGCNSHTREEASKDPGHAEKEPQLRSDASLVTCGTPGQVQPGEGQEMDNKEEEDEEEMEGGEDADCDAGLPVRPGILSRLASHVFPFSLVHKAP